jgi:hypothetical protein
LRNHCFSQNGEVAKHCFSQNGCKYTLVFIREIIPSKKNRCFVRAQNMALALPSTFLKNLDKKLFGFQVFNGLRYGFMLLASILLTHVATQTEVNTIETLLLVGATATFFFSSSIGHTLVSFAQRFTGEDKAKTYFNAFLLLTLLTFVAILCLLIIQQFAQFTDNTMSSTATPSFCSSMSLPEFRKSSSSLKRKPRNS